MSETDLQELARILDGARLSRHRRWELEQLVKRLHRPTSSAQLVKDLRAHLRDRDRYIRNLEAQLRPYLLAGTDVGEESPRPGSDQAALL